MTAVMRSGPLLLIIVTISGWVLLRSLFVLLSAPMSGLPPQPLIFAQAGADGSGLPPPLLPPPLLPRSLTELPALPTTPTSAAVAMPPPAYRSVRVTHSLATLARATRGTRPAVVLAAATPRDNDIVAAQALLLGRMLAMRSQAGRLPAYTSALTSADPLARFIPARRAPGDRWSLSAGIYVRGDGPRPSISPLPALGGTQAWARLGWRPGAGETEIFARASSAGRLGDGAEAAIGLVHRPIVGLPVSLVAERRQRIGRDGRSAFAAYAVGGTGVQVHGWRIDGYGAAGLVGAARRDGFAEGAATVARPVARFGPIEVSAGGGAWGAVQPGAERLDFGPRMTFRSDRMDGVNLAVDWRQRVAGNATPASGPALTLSMDF